MGGILSSYRRPTKYVRRFNALDVVYTDDWWLCLPTAFDGMVTLAGIVDITLLGACHGVLTMGTKRTGNTERR